MLTYLSFSMNFNLNLSKVILCILQSMVVHFFKEIFVEILPVHYPYLFGR